MFKTDHNWFFLSVKLLSDISGSLERACKVKLRTEKALGFIKDHSCLTRPVSPQCLSVPSAVHTQCCGALDLFGGAGGVQWVMV